MEQVPGGVNCEGAAWFGVEFVLRRSGPGAARPREKHARPTHPPRTMHCELRIALHGVWVGAHGWLKEEGSKPHMIACVCHATPLC